MRQKHFCMTIQFLLISAICAFPVNAQNVLDADALLSEILQAVQKNVDSQKEQIVNIFSKEEGTIEEFDDSGKIMKTTVMLSDYRVFPETTSAISDCRIVYEIMESIQPGILREERDVLSVKENDKTVKEFTEPIWAKGNSYADLFILFDKQNEQCFDYKLNGVERINERPVYAIGIKQKESDIGKNKNWTWDIFYEGVALVDAGTMEIVQLNRNSVPVKYLVNSVPVKEYYFTTQYDYDEIKIGDWFFTLPVTKTVRLFRYKVPGLGNLPDILKKPAKDSQQLDTVYKYSYSGHRAFSVGTKITFEEID